MFSYEDRCIYRRSPLIEVICQLRFPAILRIDAQAPAQFQEAIRGDYPQFSQRMENLPPRKEGGKLVPQGTQPNYQFLAKDNHWKVNLTKHFISLSTNHYTRWEDFAKRLDKVLAAFIRLYQPTYFERVGLRFINSISRRALELEGAQWRELLQPGFLGLLAEPDMKEQGVMGEGQRYDLPLAGGCRAKIQSAPAMMQRKDLRTQQEQKEAVFILDLDIYMSGQVEAPHAAAALQTAHLQADSIFRGAITPALHEAMDPMQP